MLHPVTKAITFLQLFLVNAFLPHVVVIDKILVKNVFVGGKTDADGIGILKQYGINAKRPFLTDCGCQP